MIINEPNQLELIRKIDYSDFLYIIAAISLAWLLAKFIRWILRFIAETFPARMRLPILRFIPLARLSVFVGALSWIVPVVIHPSFQNIVALFASVGLAIAFILKDYASSLLGGFITILENVYQPGDWIEMDGVYGEVKLISLRAVHIVTPDDDEVSIPHYRFWSKKITNSTNGNKYLMCIAHFYLNPDHDGLVVKKALENMALTNSYREPGSKITVIAEEQPWGTHYKLKAYVHESREQFLFITDLTLQGKALIREMQIQFACALPAIDTNWKKP
jgi:small conductance mechanosensitive channel